MKVDKNKLIGLKIKEARESSQKSQKELADALGYESATAVSLIESGERKIRAEDLDIVSNFLGKQIEFFLGRENKVPDLTIALRADKILNDEDKNAILRFIELAKKSKK